MGQKISYTINLDAEIAALSAKLKTVRTEMAAALASGKATGLDSTLKTLETRLEALKTKAKTPITSESMFGRMQSDIASLNIGADALKERLVALSKLSDDKKINLVDSATLKNIQDGIKALEKLEQVYNQKVKIESEDLKLQEAAAKATKDKAQAEKDLATASKKIKASQNSKDELEGQRDSLKIAKDVAAQKKQTAKEELDTAKKLANVNESEYQKQKKRVEEIQALYTANGKGIKRPNAQTFDGVQYNLQAEYDQLEKLSQNRDKANTDVAEKTVALKDATDTANMATDAWKKNEQAINSAATAITNNTGKQKAAQAVINDANGTIQAYNERYAILEQQMRGPGIENAKTAFQAIGISLDGIDFSKPEEAMSLLQARLESLNNDALAQLNSHLQSAGIAMDEFGQKTEEAKSTVESATQAFVEQNETARQVEGLTTRIKQFTGVAGAALIMRRAMRNAITTIKELDKQMTEMAVVTQLEVGDYWKQLPQHTEQANQLGMAIKDVYEAETLYYQQGLKTAQVQKISISTLKMARIAGLSAEDATNKMTAALRGFNMEINETNADRIADVYSKLAAITASNVQEISTAMTKTASLASNAGMEFETTAAFLSQIIETTRESAETAGTALKTVIARFQELKKAPEDIGEIDGEIVDANKIETALRTVGVALRDTQGQFRDLDDVFIELSKKWSTLDTNTQRYIATIAAGSRQQSRFIAMMSNYARTQELVNAANRAAGASNEQFNKTLSSLETKLNQLKNAWDTFTQGIANNEFIKLGIGILTKILTVLNAITKGWDSWSGSALKIGLVTTALILGDKALRAFLASLRSGTGLLAATHAGFQAIGKTIANLGTSIGKMGQKMAAFSQSWAADSATIKTTLGSAYAQVIRAQQTYNRVSAEGTKVTAQAAAAKKVLIQKSIEFGKAYGLNNAEIMAMIRMQQAGIPIEQAAAAAAKGYTKETLKEALAVEQLNGALTEEQLKKAGITLTDTEGALSKLGKRLTDLSTNGFQKLKVGFKELGAGLKSFFSTFGASIAWFAAALAILAAGITAIVAIVKQFHKNSPAGQLEIAAEKAKLLGAAADAAADKYKKLSDTLNGFKTAQANIDTLVKGTREWRDAVAEINQQYGDLIELYPKLATLETTMKNGYIEFVDQDAVDEIIAEAEGTKTKTAAAAAAADLEKKYKEQAVKFSKLSDKAKVGDPSAAGWGAWGAIAGTAAATGAGAGAAIGAGVAALPTAGIGSLPAAGIGAAIGAGVGLIGGTITAFATGAIREAKEAAEQEQQVLTDQFAKDLVEAGTMTKSEIVSWLQSHSNTYKDDQEAAERIASQMYEVQTELRSYGKSLATLDAATKAYYEQMRANTMSLIDQKKYTDQALTEMQGLLSNTFIKSIEDKISYQVEQAGKDKQLSDPNSELAQKYQAYFEEQYGTTTDINKKGKVTYTDNEGEKQTIDAETARAAFASAQALEQLRLQVQLLPKALAKVGDGVGNVNTAIRHAIKDDQGLGLSRRDMQALTNEDGSLNQALLTQLWASNEELREVYNKNIQLFFNEMGQRAKGQQIARQANDERMFELGLTQAGLSFDDALSAEAEKGLIKHMEQVVAVSGPEAGAILGDSINELLSQVAMEDRDKVAAQLNAINWYDADALEALPETFKKLGATIPNQGLEDFITTAKETAHALHNIDMDKLNESLLDLTNILNNIRTNEQGRIFDAESYNKILATDATLVTKFVQNLDGSYTYLGDSLNELTKAILGTTDAYVEEKEQTLQNQLNARRFLDEQKQTGKVEQDVSKLVGYNAGSKEQRDFITQVIANAKANNQSLDGISVYLSKDTPIEKLSNEAVQDIITKLHALGTVEAITEEWKTTVLKALTTENLKLDAYYNTRTGEAKRAGNGRATDTDIKEYHSQRLALISQAQMSNISEKDLDLLMAYNKALEELEDAQETNTTEYQEMARAANLYMRQIAKKTSFNTMYDGLSKNVEKSNELMESYQKTSSEMRKQQLVSEMMAEFNIKVTKKNYQQLATLTDAYLHGNRQGFIDLIDVSAESAGLVSENIASVYEFLDGQTRLEIQKQGAEWIAFADAMEDAGYGRWNAVMNTFEWATDELMDMVKEKVADIEMWRSPYNWLYNANQQINAQLRERQRLERDWKYAIEDNSASLDDLADNLTSQINLTSTVANEQQAIFENAKSELQDYYKYIQKDQNLAALRDAFAVGPNGQIVVNKTQLYNAKLTTDAGSLVEEEIGKIEELLDTMRNAEDAITEANDHLRELKKTGKEQYNTLLEEVTDALRNIYQKQIDTMSAIHDSITNAQEKLVDKIQEKIDDDRQAREDEKRQKTLTDKTSQLAYLRASGANSLDVLKAEKELADEQESYTDSLVDKSLQELQDANQKAADQRQEQIEIAQAQFDWWSENTAIHDAEEVLKESLKEVADGLDPAKTRVKDLLEGDLNIKAQSKEAGEEWSRQFGADMKLASIHDALYDGDTKIRVDTTNQHLSDMKDALSTGEKSIAANMAIVADGFSKALAGAETGLLTDKNIRHYSTKGDDDIKHTIAGWQDKLDKIDRQTAPPEAGDEGWPSDVDVTDNRDRITELKQATYQRRLAREAEAKAAATTSTVTTASSVTTPAVEEPHIVSRESMPGLGSDYIKPTEAQTTKNDDGNIESITFPNWAKVEKQSDGIVSISSKNNKLFDVAANKPEYYIKDEQGRRWYLIPGTYDPNAYEPSGIFVDVLPSVWAMADNWKQGYFDFPPNTNFKRFYNPLLTQFASGGLANFTGPAWLDGTHSNPELVLNQTDTANFIELKNVLSEIIKNGSLSSGMGNNYYDIDVHVDSIDSDYDIDSAANRIKELIVDDAMYRNVNAVQQIR